LFYFEFKRKTAGKPAVRGQKKSRRQNAPAAKRQNNRLNRISFHRRRELGGILRDDFHEFQTSFLE
jgi:hypothetical protein